MTSNCVYLDIFLGDRDEHQRLEELYTRTRNILAKNAVIYALPPAPEELSEEQQEILQDLDVIITSMQSYPP